MDFKKWLVDYLMKVQTVAISVTVREDSIKIIYIELFPDALSGMK